MITILITRNTDNSSGGKSGSRTSRQGEDPRILLIREGLRTMGLSTFAERFTPDLIDRTEDGKPFIPGLPDVHFNLSHSGEYIACAFSDKEIGLDLQEHSRPKTSILRIAKRFFTAEEYEAILALPEDDSAVIPDSSSDRSGSRRLLFYRLWSIKEAYLKYLGCGLRGGMNGYLPDPLPDSMSDSMSDSLSVFRYVGKKDGGDPQGADPGSRASIRFIPESVSEKVGNNILLRGKVRVICDDPLLTPAEYALTQAPEHYTMAVCADKLPEEIIIKVI